MRAAEFPFLADWFAISLRWLTLLGAVVAGAWGGDLFSISNLLLLLLLVWNLGLTLMAGFNVRLPYHRHFSLALDLLLTLSLFALAGGFFSSMWWLGILPVMIGTLYFETRGLLVVLPIIGVVLLGVTFLQTSLLVSLWLPIATLVFLGLFGALFNAVASGLYRFLQARYQAQISQQREKRRLENERLRAIYRLTATLTSTLNYQRVLESILDMSLSVVTDDPEREADDRLVSAVMLFSASGDLETVSARRLTPADRRVVLPGKEGALGQAIETDKPVLVKNPKQDVEIGRLVTLRACQEVYCFPLRIGFNAYGVLLFGHPEAGYFTPERQETLGILGHQAAIAIQNARLYQDLVDERDRMIEVQEEARKKLARDLHDGPTQSVSAIAMRINIIQRLMEKDPKAALQELARIEDLARRTTKELRHMLFTLRPLVLESQGLAAALQSMADKVKETYDQNVLLQIDESVLKDLEIGKQGVIFYIVEEAVNNARKHAHAEHIWVRLLPFQKDILRLEIQDDGVGFDVEAVNRAYDQRGSLGMVNLRERTELINGLLQIQSAPGKGTLVRVLIPMTEDAADRLHHGRKQ
ncbi:MAG: GAF domain-containing sensor histidine kinase [Anaerolineales bacterium]|nr:GAF domain-containing sensor histidine kinase [Anaerolineales bacterium]MCX7609868.1 GAF domain-containing sensor histidine kinase [Anaerolineales bacterium]MDW8227156.1 GAF domain-containing sensor histidine kinase [Anaerolineales bacterium]